MTSFFINQHENESQSSFHQSSVRISEASLNQNIMIRQKLPASFKKQIWDEISSTEPQKFLFRQKKIVEMLLNNEEKFILLFRKFYQNHKKINDWHMLANQKHLEIKQYVFSKLLKKSILQYKIQLRENLINKTKKSFRINQSPSQSRFFGLRLNNSPIKQQNKLEKIDSSPNSIHKSAVFHSQLRNSNEDYHDLFMRTLDACEGSKYIHYDFRRHQKGYENRNFYNNFIRHKNTEKQNKNQDKFCQSIKGFKNTKFSFHQNLPTKMFSVFQQNNQENPTHHSSFSNFEILSLEDQTHPIQENNKDRKNLVKKNSKKLVLKMMPHRFGNQKSVSDFIIKTQKPLLRNK